MGMASKRPILRALPAQHARARELQREVTSIVRRHFEEACERKWGEGCAMLAQQYERGEGVAADGDHAAELRATACKYGYAKACTR